MSSVTTEILFIIILLIANGIFAMSEAAVISTRKARLHQRASDGDKKAQAALALANDPHNFLATVQIGITLVGILAGAFGGATIAHELDTALETIPWLAPYSEALSLVAVVLVITYLSLVIGELVPKSIALNDPEGIASRIALPMSQLSRYAAPLVSLLSASTKIMLRLMGIKSSEEPAVTEEEIRVMITQATATGTFQQVESQMVEQVFRIGDLRVSAFMTPRTELVWLDIDETWETILEKLTAHNFSRYPVVQGKLDNVVGIVRTKDVLTTQLKGEPVNLPTLLRQPLFVPETMSALTLLEKLRRKASHTALVIDEYGGLQGLITLNDVLEEIIRNDTEPSSLDEPEIVRREDGSWLLDGMLSVDRLKDILNLKVLPGEREAGYQTLGGFVMANIDRLPIAGDHFEIPNWRFEVMDMDGHRVDKVLVESQLDKTSVVNEDGR
jgi:putative hemolysin